MRRGELNVARSFLEARGAGTYPEERNPAVGTARPHPRPPWAEKPHRLCRRPSTPKAAPVVARSPPSLREEARLHLREPLTGRRVGCGNLFLSTCFCEKSSFRLRPFRSVRRRPSRTNPPPSLMLRRAASALALLPPKQTPNRGPESRGRFLLSVSVPLTLERSSWLFPRQERSRCRSALPGLCRAFREVGGSTTDLVRPGSGRGSAPAWLPARPSKPPPWFFFCSAAAPRSRYRVRCPDGPARSGFFQHVVLLSSRAEDLAPFSEEAFENREKSTSARPKKHRFLSLIIVTILVPLFMPVLRKAPFFP